MKEIRFFAIILQILFLFACIVLENLSRQTYRKRQKDNETSRLKDRKLILNEQTGNRTDKQIEIN